MSPGMHASLPPLLVRNRWPCPLRQRVPLCALARPPPQHCLFVKVPPSTRLPPASPPASHCFSSFMTFLFAACLPEAWGQNTYRKVAAQQGMSLVHARVCRPQRQGATMLSSASVRGLN